MKLDGEVVLQIIAKRDEYLRMLDYGKSPLGKWVSKPRVVEYAVQILCWLDDNKDDDAVKSILARFEYKTGIASIGRPRTLRDKLNKIKPKAMQIILDRFRAQGVDQPTDEQILEMWTEAKERGDPIGGNMQKAATDRKKKLRSVVGNKDLRRLDDETRKLVDKKMIDRPAEIVGKLEVMDTEEGIKALFGPEGDA
jgi:hypothetical protein